MTRPTPFAALCLAASALVAPAAGAQQAGTSIAVITVAKDSPSAASAVVVGQVARQSFARNPRYALLDLESVLNTGNDTDRQTRLKRAESALERGLAAYDAFELDAALEAFAEAVVGFEQALPAVADLTPLIDAFRYQGAAYVLKGDVKNAKAKFRQTLVIAPGASLDSSKFPENVQAIFEEVRAEMAEAPTGTVTVYAAPAAAEVWVDGGFRGSAPLTVEDLAAGRHYVRVVRDGYASFGVAVDVGREAEETVQATLRPATRLSAYEDLKTRMLDNPRAAAELAKLLKVDQLLWASVESRGDNVVLDGHLVDGVGGGEVTAANKTFVTNSPRFRAEVEAWLAENFRKEGTAQLTDNGGQTNRESFLPDGPVETPTPTILITGYWLAGLSAVPAVIGLGTGIYSLYAWDAYRNQGRYVSQITGNPAAGVPNQLASQTDEARLLLSILGVTAIGTDIAFVAAGAALTAGIVCIVLGLNEKAEIEDVLAEADPPRTGVWALLPKSPREVERAVR